MVLLLLSSFGTFIKSKLQERLKFPLYDTKEMNFQAKKITRGLFKKGFSFLRARKGTHLYVTVDICLQTCYIEKILPCDH